MGKPLIHMIPSHETRLSKSITNSKVTSDSEALQPNQGLAAKKKMKNGVSNELSGSGTVRACVEGSGVLRSRTNASNESGKSSKSNESGLSSFVHSNASLSSSPSADYINYTNNRFKTTNAMVPECIITSSEKTRASSIPVSISSKLRIAVQNLDESIEITRQTTSDKKCPSFDIEKPFDSSKRSSPQEDHGAIQQFEVLLDEQEESAAVASPEVVEQARATKRVKTKNTKPKKEVSDSSVNPRVFVTRRNQKATETRGSRHRQRSITKSSNSFFSAMDNHIATRGSNKAITRRKQEPVKPKYSPLRFKTDVVRVTDDTNKAPSGTNPANNSDLAGAPSPSKTKAGRQSPTFNLNHVSTKQKKKKVYSISQGKLFVQEVKESIEVKDTGSVIMGQQQDEKGCVLNTDSTLKTVEEQVKEFNTDEVPMKSRSKTPTRSLIAKGFRWKNKQLESPPPLVSYPRNAFPPNSIKVVSDEENPSAVELLKTEVGSSNTFSYDENEEDSIIKRISPPPTPIPQIESLKIVGEDNDIEIVATSSSCATSVPLQKGDPMEKIICIRKLGSPSAVQIKVISQDQSQSPVETSAPPKKFEPVVETPSNRVEGNVAELERAGSYEGSYTTQSASSIPSVSRTDPSSNTPNGHITPNQHKINITDEAEAEAPQNGDQLIFVGQENSVPKIAKGVFIPKIPAPKKDSNCKSHVGSNNTSRKSNEPADAPAADGPTSDGRSRKVNIQLQSVQKSDGSVKNIEVSAMASLDSLDSSTSESKISSPAMKMIVKRPLPAQASIQQNTCFDTAVLFKPKHVVRVNVLGIAGIVVDRTKCRDVTGNASSPCPPEQMTAVVGISESGQESIDNVTTFSSALTLAPNRNTPNSESEDESQRYIAVWASNDERETPGFEVESKMLNLNTKFLDLSVALAKSNDDTHHAAVVIGTARIDITEQLLSERHNCTIDLPVHKVLNEGPSSLSDRNRVVLLRTASKYEVGVPKPCVEQVSDQEDNDNREDLTSAYAIDPSGDSMIRVQIHVEEVIGMSAGSFNDRTAATERSEESSIPSYASSKQPERKKLYSEQIDFPHNFVDDDGTFHTVAWKKKLLGKSEDSNEADLPGYRIFGKRIDLRSCRKGIAQQIDDRIEDISEHILSHTCSAAHRDDASLDRYLDHDDSLTFTTNHTDASGRKLFTLKELRDLAKEFALSSGEYFFPMGAPESSEKGLAVVDEESNSTSVESALLVSFDNGQLLNKESWQKKRDEDDNTYSTGASGDQSESTGSLNKLNLDAVRFNFDDKRRVMSESNKFDIDSDNDSKVIYDSRTYDGYPGELTQLSDCDGDDEVSSLEVGEKSLTDKVFAHKGARDIQRQSSGKPSLPSVVENIAEVLSIGGKACGYFGVDEVDNVKTIPTTNWNQEIPTTLEQFDLQSVGELTAITLEKNEIQETNRKLLMKKLGLPKDILGWSTVGSNKANAGNGTENEKSQGQNSGKPEDYFSEYGEGASGTRSIYEISEPFKSNEKVNVVEA